jgi:hypothetical protein
MGVGEDKLTPGEVRKSRRRQVLWVPLNRAFISLAHVCKAVLSCFLHPHETATPLKRITKDETERRLWRHRAY